MTTERDDISLSIVLTNTGRGLRRDASIIEDIARDLGFSVKVILLTSRSDLELQLLRRVERVKARFPPPLCALINRAQMWALGLRRWLHPSKITIHLENISRRNLDPRSTHWLIPNLEWFRTDCTHYIPFMDRVVCKTRDAQEVFEGLHAHVIHTGFSSGSLPSLKNPIKHRYDQVLHVAGNNLKKGTGVIEQLWAKHPEWPILHLVVDSHRQSAVSASNLVVYSDIEDSELSALRQQCGLVLAPSEAEGFGHVLLEGMAWGGVVITVDAPPMNELVSPDRGFCVPWVVSKPCRMGNRYFVDADALEETLERIFRMDAEPLKILSDHARQWVKDNHQRFIADFSALLQEQKIP